MSLVLAAYTDDAWGIYVWDAMQSIYESSV